MGAPSREEEEEAKKMEAGGDTVGQKLDAGALFVLQSKGAPSIASNMNRRFSFFLPRRTSFSSVACRSRNPGSSTYLVFLEPRHHGA